MDNRHTILQLIRRGDAEGTDQARTIIEGLPDSRWRQVVAGTFSPRLRERLAQRGIRWVNLAIPNSFSPRDYLTASRQLRRLMAAQQIDLVHCRSLEAVATTLLSRPVLGWGQALPLVTTLHTVPSAGGKKISYSWLKRTGLRWLLARCEAVIVSSQRDRQLLEELIPQVGSRTRVIHPSLEHAPIRSYEAGAKRKQVGLHRDTAIVGLVSRLERGRGAESFLEAAATIHQEWPNVEFAIIGEGRGRQELEQLAHRLGLSGVCIFLGQRRDARQIIEALNLIVLLSDADKAALHGLQALAAGLPIIAAQTPELTEVFADLPGAEFVEITEAAQLAAAMRAELSAPPEIPKAEVVIEGRPSITYRDFFVSETGYDLEESWADMTKPQQDQSPIAHAVQERYGTERMIAEFESVYHQSLKE